MPIDYVNGKIYCIRNRAENDKIVYVGSSVRPLSERMNQHRQSMKRKPNFKIYALMATVGVDNFHIELIHNFPCENKEQLLAEEGRLIRLHDTVNAGCNMNVAGQQLDPVLKANREKAYRDANKEKKANVDKLYQEMHKDERKAYMKTYNEENAEQIAAQQKTYREAHKAEVVAKKKEYYEAHKAEITAYKKAWFQRKQAERLAVN